MCINAALRHILLMVTQKDGKALFKIDLKDSRLFALFSRFIHYSLTIKNWHEVICYLVSGAYILQMSNLLFREPCGLSVENLRF